MMLHGPMIDPKIELTARRCRMLIGCCCCHKLLHFTQQQLKCRCPLLQTLCFFLYFFFQPTRLICKTVTVAGATAAREDYAN